jgi:membrane protein YqaA with SNARE-associated domain
VSEPLSVRRVVLSTVAALVGITAIVAGTAYLFREWLLSVSQYFVESFGGPGIGGGFFVCDAFTVPLPADAFSTFGLVGGMDFWAVVAWGSVGSLAGGSTGWAIGHFLIGRSARLRAYLDKKGEEVVEQLHRGGLVFLAAAALTPLPYSVVCWAAGATHMPFAHFFAVSLLRIVRVAGYLWLIERGFLSVVG